MAEPSCLELSTALWMLPSKVAHHFCRDPRFSAVVVDRRQALLRFRQVTCFPSRGVATICKTINGVLQLRVGSPAMKNVMLQR